ncbi:MAG: AAA domain-containing protein [Gemmatimonadales bacterium]
MPDEPLEIVRARQLFSFLKAFAEQRMPRVRQVSNHPWTMYLRELIPHPDIHIGEVLLGDSAEGTAEEEGEDSVLLRVRHPKLTPAPVPPAAVRDYLTPGWEDPAKAVETIAFRNVIRAGETVTEHFTDDPERVAKFQRWVQDRDAWVEAEKPARKVMQIFTRLFALHQQIGLQSEQVELVFGDGRLRWNGPDGAIDHPVLLQRVELLFDTELNQFEVVDADRPPELYGSILVGTDAAMAGQMAKARKLLEEGGFHPLAGDPTSGFLKNLTSLLGPGADFVPKQPETPTGTDPIIGRDPILMLRVRPQGFSAAFDRILEDLQRRTKLSPALTGTLGVPPEDRADGPRDSVGAWSEPPDVLLSKPANDQQIQIARVLEQKRSVLVQGPPGTGKSHTIANLIGHLVAQGKRVLVTSHTTKALSVLRDLVVESLRPLCVSVLENDSVGRAQLEESINGILSRLSTSSEDELARESGDLAVRRGALIAEIDGTVKGLSKVRLAEYVPIVLADGSVEPAEGAAFVREHADTLGWIPPGVHAGAPLPLSVSELEELYASNARISMEEEAELLTGLPELDTLLQPSAFTAAISELVGVENQTQQAAWAHPVDEGEIFRLEQVETGRDQFNTDLGGMVPWQRALVLEGYSGSAGIKLWQNLATLVREADEQWNRSRAPLLANAIGQLPPMPMTELKTIAGEVMSHLKRGGKLGWLTLLWRPRWKAAIRGTRVNEEPPSTLEHFNAIAVHLVVEEGRKRVQDRWKRLAEPMGLPTYAELPTPKEPSLTALAEQFQRLLDWWAARWLPLESELRALGLRWDQIRADAVASNSGLAPFERDTDLIRRVVGPSVSMRAAAARAARARRLLAENVRMAEAFRGTVGAALLAAARNGDSGQYEAHWLRLRDLMAKGTILQQRHEGLKRLAVVAPNWANAVTRREGIHGEARLPGEPRQGWKWVQLHDEIAERRALDEATLQRRLEVCQARLRDTTADLIDRRAWLGQLRRVDLNSRLALNGWAQTRRRIGKGTGKRAPALQAQARRQLARAQAAVPVWIMPLARVAEAVDPATSGFDVVIIDEASQCDPTGLLAWYLADQVAVVGDDKQVSPMAVGQQLGLIQNLINQHLTDVPNHELYDGQLSLYDLAQQSFGGTVRLREHFRCMPEIIEFSNELSYNFEIQPLRNPYAVSSPHVVEQMAVGATRDGKTNLAEARWIAALIGAIDESPAYEGATLGAISLLADEQAHLIWSLAGSVVDPTRLERRRFVAGNSAQFQGDERDIIFLSMVDSPKDGPLPLRQDNYLKQRYNVAASRAKDLLWLVHSLDPGRDLKPGDLRRHLIEYVRSPGARGKAAERASRRVESPFEKAVIERLVAAGFQVIPQVKVGSYRIDMVVRGGGGQVAIECDGARFHPPEKVPDDLMRQANLERCGWTFIRIRSTAFFSDPDRTMLWVLDQLRAHGVEPDGFGDGAPETLSSPLIDQLRARAWEIMGDKGWLSVEPGLVGGLEGIEREL